MKNTYLNFIVLNYDTAVLLLVVYEYTISSSDNQYVDLH